VPRDVVVVRGLRLALQGDRAEIIVSPGVRSGQAIAVPDHHLLLTGDLGELGRLGEPDHHLAGLSIVPGAIGHAPEAHRLGDQLIAAPAGDAQAVRFDHHHPAEELRLPARLQLRVGGQDEVARVPAVIDGLEGVDEGPARNGDAAAILDNSRVGVDPAGRHAQTELGAVRLITAGAEAVPALRDVFLPGEERAQESRRRREGLTPLRDPQPDPDRLLALHDDLRRTAPGKTRRLEPHLHRLPSDLELRLAIDV